MEKILRSTGYQVENREELKEVVPAAFSGNHNRSKVYSFVSTEEILDNLEKLGWTPTSAKQQGSSAFSRHIIRLANPELGFMPLKNDRVRPQLILDNSHNGGSSAQLHMGLFRLVCESELVVCIPNVFNNIKFRHMGLNLEELKEILGKMTEQYKIVGAHIAEMQNIVISNEQQLDFAYRGAAYRDPRRYINDDGTINTKNFDESIDPKVLLQPMRGGDAPSTLWDTFQIVREWLIKGGFEQKSEKGRQSKSKPVNNAVRQIALNKTLWVMAEEYLGKPETSEMFNKLVSAANSVNTITETKSESSPASEVIDADDLITYTNSKGLAKQVILVADLGNGFIQVRDINSKSTFSIPSSKVISQ